MTASTTARTAVYVKLQHVAELPDDVRLTINAENVSDPEYFQDFSQGTAATSTAFLERTRALSYRDENWRLSGELQEFQTLVPTYILTDYQRPYAEVPRLVADGNFALGSAEQLRYGFDSELVDFTRAVGVKGWRFDLLPRHRSISARPATSCVPGSPGASRSTSCSDIPPVIRDKTSLAPRRAGSLALARGRL
jgi:lipopolysaccharide assembly outer membrane protein LptD (OstA)